MAAPTPLVLENNFGEETSNVVRGQALPLAGGNGQTAIFAGATAPVNTTTGKDFAGKGSLYVAQDTGVLYSNTGTISSPTWAQVYPAV